MSRQQDQVRRSGEIADPVRLCVFTTVALLTWVGGPLVVAALAGLGFTGYLRAWRRGLTSSRCILRDIRLVLAYLGVIGLMALAGVARQAGLLG